MKNIKLVDEISNYTKSIGDIINFISERNDIVESLNVNENIVNFETIVPLPSCSCDFIRKSDGNSFFNYHITSNCAWDMNTELSFYGYCFNLKVVQEKNRIGISFTTDEDLRKIIYKMCFNDYEYRLDWLLKNYKKMIRDVELYFEKVNEKSNLTRAKKKLEATYQLALKNNEIEMQEVYNEKRYVSDGLYWVRSSIKSKYKPRIEEMENRIRELFYEINKIKICSFNKLDDPRGKHVVSVSSDGNYYCF